MVQLAHLPGVNTVPTVDDTLCRCVGRCENWRRASQQKTLQQFPVVTSGYSHSVLRHVEEFIPWSTWKAFHIEKFTMRSVLLRRSRRDHRPSWHLAFSPNKVCRRNVHNQISMAKPCNTRFCHARFCHRSSIICWKWIWFTSSLPITSGNHLCKYADYTNSCYQRLYTPCWILASIAHWHKQTIWPLILQKSRNIIFK